VLILGSHETQILPHPVMLFSLTQNNDAGNFRMLTSLCNY